MRVDVSGQKLQFPPQCTCCGGVADSLLTVSATKSTGKRVVHTNTRCWDFPYCSACLAHVNAAKQATNATTAVVVVIALISLAFFTMSEWVGGAFLMLGIVGSVLLWRSMRDAAEKMRSPACISVDPAVIYLGWQGQCHSFFLKAPGYAFAFMKSNEKKLVNVSPEAWNWLHAGQPPVAQQVAKRFIT